MRSKNGGITKSNASTPAKLLWILWIFGTTSIQGVIQGKFDNQFEEVAVILWQFIFENIKKINKEDIKNKRGKKKEKNKEQRRSKKNQ
eukprot:TRINITY_DN27957_c0_g1_i1.p3 TRINITY_DN27957_c0_g1~~TRINITY_DN27957_c0_g1_i1.p3  ORF type:complete len:101 (-),score=10.91 TRINITY_DN27957_c0_g1_i1:97-360(-)